MNGEYDAFDATTGQQLWSSKLDAGVAAPGMTYSVNGKQYVAIYAGGATFSFEAIKPDTFRTGTASTRSHCPRRDYENQRGERDGNGRRARRGR